MAQAGPKPSAQLMIQGNKAPKADPKRDQFKNKADVVAFLKKLFSDGAATIKAKGDTGMSALVVDPFSNQQTPVSYFAYGGGGAAEARTGARRN